MGCHFQDYITKTLISILFTLSFSPPSFQGKPRHPSAISVGAPVEQGSSWRYPVGVSFLLAVKPQMQEIHSFWKNYYVLFERISFESKNTTSLNYKDKASLKWKETLDNPFSTPNFTRRKQAEKTTWLQTCAFI